MAGRCLSAMILVLALGALPRPADAGMLSGTFVGSITRADEGNRLGVQVGDTFSLALSIDPDLATVFEQSPPTFVFAPGDVSSLLLQVGGFSFDEEDDVSFGSGGVPAVILSPDRMRIVGVDFIAELGLATRDEVGVRSIGAPSGTASLWVEEDIDTHGRFTVGGSVRFVPEPPFALALGLAALAWRRRRKV